MDFNLLFDNFDLLLNSPQHIPKLNEAILQMAVMGKLVPQDPKDEPASELLKKIKKINFLPLISQDKIHYKLANNWLCVKFGDFISLEYGKGLPKTKRNNSGNVPVYASNGIVGYHTNFLVDKPCIVIGRKGSSGAVNLALNPCWIIDTAYFVIPPNCIEITYLFYLLKSLDLPKLGRGIKPGLNRNDVYNLIIGIPPLNEQKRIVSKIETLLKKTEEIKNSLTRSDKELTKLTGSTLNKWLKSDNKKDFSEISDFIFNNFNLLFNDERNIKELKQAILELAVKGKLAPQNPSDEPASELLKKIKAEKERLTEEKKIKKEKPLPPISKDEVPYELPEGWVYTHLGEITYDFKYGTSDKSDYSYDGIPVIRIPNISKDEINLNDLKYLENKDVPDNNKIKNGDILIIRSNGSRDLVGKCSLVKDISKPLAFASYLIRLRPTMIFSEYVLLLLKSDSIKRQFFSKAKTTVGINNINTKELASTIIPLPPLDEQKRIVEKVETLMKLCDGLEAQIAGSKQQSEKLMGAVLKEAFENKSIKLTQLSHRK